MNTGQRIDEAFNTILSHESLETRLREAAAYLSLLDGKDGVEKMSKEAQEEYNAFFEKMSLQPIPLDEAARHLKFFIWQALSETEIERFAEKSKREVESFSRN